LISQSGLSFMIPSVHVRGAARVIAMLLAASVASRCGSVGGAHPSPTPTVTAVLVTSGGASAQTGQSTQLTATATLSDGTTQTVTTQATWGSTNTAVATVSSAGVVTFVAPGDVDVRATYQSVMGTLHFAVTAVTLRFRLSGVITDSGNQRGVEGVLVEILNGPDAGRSTRTDANGAYSFADVVAGTFTVRVSKQPYEAVERQVTVSADTTLSIALNIVVDFSAFYGTFNVSLRVIQQNCESPVVPDSRGQLTLNGNRDGSSFQARIVERGTTRMYSGFMRSDGTFNANGGGVIAGILAGPPTSRHDYTGNIEGRVSNGTVNGSENVLFGAPCPGKILQLGFSGSK
jgi:Carboxypeptidase regulatory-like domain/Bacterial Ig-like domain (group 2)